MAGVTCVVVLTPNGRRQTVKASPNMTVLQVLEEVCKKHGFNPQDYDLRHHNHVLDTTNIMRFSGLPNNAQLEMIKVQKVRRESEVTVSLQCESGDRLTGTFLPSDSLWNVVMKLYPNDEKCEGCPVIVYMRREIVGEEALKATILRSLGVTSGRVMLRFLYRSPNAVPHQANVSSTLPPRQTTKFVHARYKSQQANLHTYLTENTQADTEADQLSGQNSRPNKPTENVEKRLTGTGVSQESEPMELETEDLIEECLRKNRCNNSQPQTSKMDCKMRSMSNPNPSDQNDTKTKMSTGNSKKNPQSNTTQSSALYSPAKPDNVILVGDRNALVFSLSMAQAVPCSELPEDFFDLTLEDVRSLFRDLKSKRDQMNEQPLQTAAARELEESKRILSQLNKYKRVVLRINFPDRTVLQATFTPVETIATVSEFVRGFLEDPTMEFYLYTTPPKVILSPSLRLIEAQCVPSAVLHFGTNEAINGETRFLKEEILANLSSFQAATIAASQSRGLVTPSSKTQTPRSPVTTRRNNEPKPSTSKACHENEDEPGRKVPKWFKPSK